MLVAAMCLGPNKRANRKHSYYPGGWIVLNGSAAGPRLVPSMFGDDESDVVVLLVGAEALDFIDDRSERIL